jgi:uncharacterized RDD family membrane protein YckC
MMQDGTGQGPGGGAPEPGWAAALAEPGETAGPAAPDQAGRAQRGPAESGPSPYLEAGEAIPEAYLAPPQPGQPRYGLPPSARLTVRGPQQYPRPVNGQPGSGQSGYGQPGYGRSQPGRPGQRGFGQPRAGSRAAARDPAAAAPWQRLAASCLDWLLIVVVATAIFFGPLLHLWRQMQAIATTYPDLSAPAAQAAINNVASEPASQRALLYWLLAIFGLALGYFWVQHAAWGATIGKRLLGLRVVSAADQSRIGVRAAGIRAVAVIIGPLLFLLLASPVNLIGGVLWLADSALPLIDLRVQCLHDKVAGTMVVRDRWLAQRRQAGPW